MAMDWLGIGEVAPSGAPPTMAELQAKLDQKEAELKQARSQSHQQSDRYRQSQNLLLSQIESTGLPEDDLLENFDWSKALGEGKEKKMSDDKQGGSEITFKSKEDLNRWMDQRDAKKQQAALEAAQKAQQVQQTLIQKFISEHKELVPHQELVGRLWNKSMQLNANIDPTERFKGVIEESKFLIEGGYGVAPQRQPHPSTMNPYMPSTPSSGSPQLRQASAQSPYEGGYDPVSHSAELKERQQATLDKMFF